MSDDTILVLVVAVGVAFLVVVVLVTRASRRFAKERAAGWAAFVAAHRLSHQEAKGDLGSQTAEGTVGGVAVRIVEGWEGGSDPEAVLSVEARTRDAMAGQLEVRSSGFLLGKLERMPTGDATFDSRFKTYAADSDLVRAALGERARAALLKLNTKWRVVLTLVDGAIALRWYRLPGSREDLELVVRAVVALAGGDMGGDT